MINCVFLSRDFPFTWFLDDFKDVLSWPDERKSKFLMMKPIYYETLQQNECCNLCCIGNCKWTWLQKYRGMQQMLNFLGSLTSSSVGAQTTAEWAGGQPRGGGESTGLRRATLAESASLRSTGTKTAGRDQMPDSHNQRDFLAGKASPATAMA